MNRHPPDTVDEKLARFLARCGIASRRKCEDLIRAGLVQVDGAVVSTPETRIRANQCAVSVRGKPVKPQKSFRYILFNKPEGVLCTCHPSREIGRTVLDLVRVPERVFPAGRLDRDTSGLVLLTNDGELVQQLTHPSYEREKEYLVETRKLLSDDEVRRLVVGIRLDDGFSRFANVQRVGQRRVKVILKEGRKRQIRRTFEALNLPIRHLQRIRLDKIVLTRLPVGQWRDLTAGEIQSLKRSER
ncbi:MAG: pseudouridine synthase [bacterium]